MRSLVCALILTAACNRGLVKVKTGAACTPGTSIECTCRSGAAGSQQCESDAKSYSDCSCERQLGFLVGPPASLTAGKTFSLHLVVQDSFGDIRDDDNARVTLALEGMGTLDGDVLGRFEEGEAQFSGLSVTTVQAGARIVATSRGQSVSSAPFTVTTGPPVQLAWKDPLPLVVISGVPLEPVPEIVVRDAFGNVTMPPSPILVTLMTTESLVAVAPSVVFMSGEAQAIADLRLTGGAQAVRVVASAGGLQSAISNAMQVVAIDPEWPSTRVPDSPTLFCGNGVVHVASHCESLDPPGDLQDGARLSPPLGLETSGGVLFDRTTGLVWEATERPFGPTTNDLPSAISHCAALTQGGLSWRLPTRWEAITLLDLGAVNLNHSLYTTSVGLAPNVGNWAVNMTGNTYAAPLSALYTRCVSGPPLVDGSAGAPAGQYAPFVLLSPTVRDLRTHLDWQRSSSSGFVTWTQALVYCRDLIVDGVDDWRLPTMKELLSISDVRRTNPTFDPAAFPDGNAASHWWTSSAVHLWQDPATTTTDNGVWVISALDGRTDVVNALDGTQRYGTSTGNIFPPRARCVRDGD